eukprot:GILK01003501.1.p1 GENE.GILK01003501.1~~GILK01003501.1.p1  ORF type:complete len:150 (+),score=21.13 GILK01003501.1:38-451(+)
MSLVWRTRTLSACTSPASCQVVLRWMSSAPATKSHARVPLIKFIGKRSRSGVQAHSPSSPSPSAPAPPSASSSSSAAVSQVVSMFDLPPQYRRKAFTQDEMDAINMGGIFDSRYTSTITLLPPPKPSKTAAPAGKAK